MMASTFHVIAVLLTTWACTGHGRRWQGIGSADSPEQFKAITLAEVNQSHGQPERRPCALLLLALNPAPTLKSNPGKPSIACSHSVALEGRSRLANHAPIMSMSDALTLVAEAEPLKKGRFAGVEERLRDAMPIEHLEIVDVTDGHALEAFLKGSKRALRPDGLELRLTIVSSAFDGIRPLERQRLVNNALDLELQAGTIHSLPFMKALPSAQWQSAHQENKDALELARQKFGEEHPDTLKVLREYADALGQLGCHAEAEPLRREVLEITRHNLDLDLSETLRALSEYADTLGLLRCEDEVEPLRKEVLDLTRQNLGLAHRDTIKALDSYADTLGKLGRHIEAEPFKKEVFELSRQSLGSEHTDTLKAMQDYTDKLAKIGRHAEAEPLKLELLEIRRKELGLDHSDTLKALKSYADTLGELGRCDSFFKFISEYCLVDADQQAEAELCQKEVLDVTRRVLGRAHPDSLRALDDYVKTLLELGRAVEAEPFRKELLDLTRQNLGSQHPDSLAALESYANALSELGRESEAEPFREELLELTSQSSRNDAGRAA